MFPLEDNLGGLQALGAGVQDHRSLLFRTSQDDEGSTLERFAFACLKGLVADDGAIVHGDDQYLSVGRVPASCPRLE